MSDEVLTEIRGRAGVLTLNRPKALNALTRGMIGAIQAALTEWIGRDEIERVVLRAVPGRAFCAGGDIRAIYELGRAGDPTQVDFFAEEYRLNAFIKHFPKPFVSLIDGICMGGGAGLSIHGSHRVASEKLLFSMPETGIGFFPDVGSSFFLSRMPGRTGLFAALSAARLTLADALETGLVTHPVASDGMADLFEAIVGTEDLDAVLAERTIDPGHAPLAEARGRIDSYFGQRSVGEILSWLDEAAPADAGWAGEVAATLRSKSPMSLAITFREIGTAARLPFDDCMQMEFAIMSRILKGHDFYEGVRAVLIDKDQTPHWNPSSIEEIEIADVEAHFQTPASGPLVLPAA